MRNWINLIEGYIEGDVPATIYHGTGLRALIRIIGLNALTGSEDDHGGEGTFCSDRVEVSMRYIKDGSYRCPEGGVIVFDTGSIIRAGYDIQPYEYHSGNDGIEYVIDSRNDLTPASSFIKQIMMTRANYDFAQDAFNTYQECAYVEDEWNNYEDYVAAFEKFLSTSITVV